MELLTIGAFAKASRLSPKALRLYDELRLLRPARVDPDTGYRYYATAQLERARLVAWLRRLGMPLAGIRAVCALDAAGAAREIRAYWARVEAETAVRRDLAEFLVDQLTGEGAGPVGGRRARSRRRRTGPPGGRQGERHHADRAAVDGVEAGARAHRGLAGVSAAGRGAVPHHPRPQCGAVADRREAG